MLTRLYQRLVQAGQPNECVRESDNVEPTSRALSYQCQTKSSFDEPVYPSTLATSASSSAPRRPNKLVPETDTYGLQQSHLMVIALLTNALLLIDTNSKVTNASGVAVPVHARI